MALLWYFLAGLFAWNAIPHLVKGITGQSHMTPFGKVSSPSVNVIYAAINVVFALYMFGLASGKGGLTLPWEASLAGANLWAALIGGVFIALADAWLFSKPNAHLPWQK